MVIVVNDGHPELWLEISSIWSLNLDSYSNELLNSLPVVDFSWSLNPMPLSFTGLGFFPSNIRVFQLHFKVLHGETLVHSLIKV